MKVLGATVLVLLCTMALLSQALEDHKDIATSCCFSFVAHRIPRRSVVDYFETSNLCSKHSVVFVTKRGRQVCADPSKAWVQELIRSIEAEQSGPTGIGDAN